MKFARGKFNFKNKEKYIGLKTPTYRSSWEQSFMRLCDEHPNVHKWASEAVKIPYRHPFTGKYTIYVPDFFIVYVDKNGKKHAELIEVKPMNQTSMEKAGRSVAKQKQVIINQAKWSAASDYSKQNRITFRVVSEEQLFHQGNRK
jgi:hypothetical protein|tara:strand:- start:953 stop:1387 length:435 start_codon:yes stop_codon:yes gene_type:complete